MHFKLERTLFQQSLYIVYMYIYIVYIYMYIYIYIYIYCILYIVYCIYVFHSAPFVAKKEKRFCNIIDYSVLPIGNSRPGRSSSELVRQK